MVEPPKTLDLVTLFTASFALVDLTDVGVIDGCETTSISLMEFLMILPEFQSPILLETISVKDCNDVDWISPKSGSYPKVDCRRPDAAYN